MKKKALVIGGTSGLGLEYCKLLINNFELSIISSNVKNLKRVKLYFKKKFKKKIFTSCVDFASQEKINFFLKKNKKFIIDHDLVIYSSSISYYGNYLQKKYSLLEKVIYINLLNPVRFFHFFNKNRYKYKNYTIVYVGSVVGYYYNKSLSVYSLSKLFMRFFIQLLQSNNNKSNINFCYIVPGSMRTNFIKKIKIKSNYFSYDASEIAKTSLKDILQNKTIIIPGFLNKFFVFLYSCLPINFVEFIKKILKKK